MLAYCRSVYGLCDVIQVVKPHCVLAFVKEFEFAGNYAKLFAVILFSVRESLETQFDNFKVDALRIS